MHKQMPIRKPRSAHRGVSLIEALIALAVMAIGMLGLVGMQASLRANSDISKQRAEAVRIAQQAIEEWRAINALRAAVGVRAYEDLADQTDAAIVGANATYLRSRTVRNMDTRVGIAMADTLPRAKSLTVRVTWQDRTSVGAEVQSVVLTSAVSGVAPDLASTLAVPGDGDVARQPFGRNRNVPVQAVDLGDGRSAFTPPGAPAGVQWVFANSNALITLCNLINAGAGISAANISCSNTKALLYSGVFRYSLGPAQPTLADARDPQSARPAALAGLTFYVDQTLPFASTPPGRQCFADHSVTPATYTPFFCAIPVQAPGETVSVGWTGTLRAEPADQFAATIDALPAGKFRLCRYGALGTFNDVRVPLVNQNMLVINDGNNLAVPPVVFSCPGSGTTTWPQQPDS